MSDAIAKARGLVERATKGPWKAQVYVGEHWHAAYPNGEDSSEGKESDARLIVAAVNTFPLLLDVLEQIAEPDCQCVYCGEVETHLEQCSAGKALAALERELGK